MRKPLIPIEIAGVVQQVWQNNIVPFDLIEYYKKNKKEEPILTKYFEDKKNRFDFETACINGFKFVASNKSTIQLTPDRNYKIN